jgi:hypothetical protein
MNLIKLTSAARRIGAAVQGDRESQRAIGRRAAHTPNWVSKLQSVTRSFALILALATPAAAGGDAYPPAYPVAPPAPVYAPPPPPPLVQFGGFLGAVATLPFAVIGGLFGAIAPPPCYDPSSGAPMPCLPPPPATYMPYQPAPSYPEPRTYGGPHKGYERPEGGCYDDRGNFQGQDNPDCRS